MLGLGTAPQEGREPVSGVSGSGVGGEPYDQGNVEGMRYYCCKKRRRLNKR